MSGPLIEVCVPLDRLAACQDEEEREALVIDLCEGAGADWRRIAGTPTRTATELVYRVPPLNPWFPRD